MIFFIFSHYDIRNHFFSLYLILFLLLYLILENLEGNEKEIKYKEENEKEKNIKENKK